MERSHDKKPKEYKIIWRAPGILVKFKKQARIWICLEFRLQSNSASWIMNAMVDKANSSHPSEELGSLFKTHMVEYKPLTTVKWFFAIDLDGWGSRDLDALYVHTSIFRKSSQNLSSGKCETLNPYAWKDRVVQHLSWDLCSFLSKVKPQKILLGNIIWCSKF